MIDIKKVNTPIKRYTAKVIPLAFDESMSYYQCICNIANHINNNIIPVVNETEETVITLSNDFKDLKDYIDDNMLTKDVDDLTYYTKTSDLSSVATSGNYNDLSNKPTIPDVSNFITKDVNDLTYYTLTSNLSSVATSGSYNDLSNKPTIPPTMTILSYGHSTWNDFITAYNSNTIVYCRASSNSNPGTGSQTRLGFMAYVNNETTPTEVEFQYYRSVSSHSDSQQGDQVIVYKLTSGGTWTVTTREAYSKIVAGTNLSSSYSSGTLTINNTLTVPTKTSDLNNDSGFITNSVNNLTNYTDTTTLTTLLADKENVSTTGSNSNGNYVKFDNGILIQWNKMLVTDQAIANSYGSLYQGARDITFPIAFVGDTPAVQCSEFQYGTQASWGCVVGNNTTLTGTTLRGFDVASRSSGTNVHISWIAIGKWK